MWLGSRSRSRFVGLVKQCNIDQLRNAVLYSLFLTQISKKKRRSYLQSLVPFLNRCYFLAPKSMDSSSDPVSVLGPSTSPISPLPS